MKWLLIAIATLTALLVGFYFYFVLVTNSKVAAELRAEPQGQRAAIVMLLTFADGKEIPVNYLREGNKVFAGADGPWWREFKGAGAPVTLEIRGAVMTGHAVVVLDQPDYVKDVFARLRPNVPEWLPDWLNGKLVEITLEG
jgi:hypothetical protein